MVTNTFINGEDSPKFNAETLGMLYSYWHNTSEDTYIPPSIDEQKEIEELTSILLPTIILRQISVQPLVIGEFAYTYIFKGPDNNLDSITTNVISFLLKVSELTKKANDFYATPIKGTNIVIGTIIIE